MKLRKIALLAMFFSFSIGSFYAMEQKEERRKFKDVRVINELSILISKNRMQATNLLDNVIWKIDVNVYGENGHYPIHDAVLAGDLEMVKNLVENHGADVNVLTQKSQYSPLDIAVKIRQKNIIEYLRNVRAKYNQYDVQTGTFRQEQKMSEQEVLRAFEKKLYTWLKAKDYEGAVKGVGGYFNKYSEYIKKFERISMGLGDVSPLSVVVSHGDEWLPLIKLFVEQGGFDVNRGFVGEDWEPGNTPYEVALKNKCKNIAEFLREKGAKTTNELTQGVQKK